MKLAPTLGAIVGAAYLALTPIKAEALTCDSGNSPVEVQNNITHFMENPYAIPALGWTGETKGVRFIYDGYIGQLLALHF